MKFSLLFVSFLVLFSSCQSEVCKCADQWYEMTEALKKADEQKQDIEPILKKYETGIEKCRDMDAKMTPQEKEEMIAELKTCSSYKKLGGVPQ
jgi:hypothetical protein